MSTIVARAQHLIEDLREVRKVQELMCGLGEFIELLKMAADPDEPAISDAEIRTLEALSNNAIEIIEARIDAGEDKSAVQRKLASAVYDISQKLERVDRWRRGSRPRQV